MGCNQGSWKPAASMNTCVTGVSTNVGPGAGEVLPAEGAGAEESHDGQSEVRV